MADQDQGSKTEQPTSKKLNDARKKGDVAKVADVSLTLGFIFALLLLWLIFDQITEGLFAIMDLAMSAPTRTFDESINLLGEVGLKVYIGISALVLIPLSLFSLMVEFIVIGPVFTSEKIKPKISNLNPAEGLKKMFGPDNIVELFKSIFKTLILCLAFYLTVSALISELLLLPGAEPEDIMGAIWYLAIRILGWSSAAFIMIMFLDTIYQKHSFTKKMMMSIRDIRDELKQTEGDPQLKGARKDLGQEWAQAPAEAASQANVLVVNPIHVAIAIVYDREKTKIPVITGKGEEKLAREMRDAAAKAGVPVLRNEQLARALLADRTEGNYVPKALFDIIAEVILWSSSVKPHINNRNSATGSGPIPFKNQTKLIPPGEDLTTYR